MAHRPKTSLHQGLSDEAEVDVVKRAIAGDDLAFTELVLRHSARIRNHLRQLSSQYGLADDLAQLTFVQAWKNIRRLQSADAFTGWLNRIALNLWLDELRRGALPYSDAETLETIQDTKPDPANQTTGVDIERALATLNMNERLCVVMAYNDGFTSEEIAGLTQLPLGTVKSHIRRGSAKVRKLLGAYESHE